MGQYYQWIKGSNVPNIETFNKEITLGNQKFLLFKSGQQVATNLVGEYVVEIDSPEKPAINIEEYFKELNKSNQKQPVSYDNYLNNDNNQVTQKISENKTNLGNAEVIPHPDDIVETKKFYQKQSPQIQNENDILGYSSNNIQKQETQQIQKNDPLFELINNAKKEDTEIEIKLKLKLPSKDFFKIIKESFSGKENDIVNHVKTLIKNEDFEKELKKFIFNYLEIEEPKKEKIKPKPKKRKYTKRKTKQTNKKLTNTKTNNTKKLEEKSGNFQSPQKEGSP